MPPSSVQELVPILQTAIGPMILISGVGLLLITMSNRLARTIDRARELAAQLSRPGEPAGNESRAQLSILWRRARLIRAAIWLASVGALCAALLIILLFLTALFGLETAGLIGALFIACMTCLILSLVMFIRDVNQSLTAVQLELQKSERKNVAPGPGFE